MGWVQCLMPVISASQAQVIFLPQPPEQLGLQVHATMPSYFFFFFFFLETGSYHVAQADLELLGSSILLLLRPKVLGLEA